MIPVTDVSLTQLMLARTPLGSRKGAFKAYHCFGVPAERKELARKASKAAAKKRTADAKQRKKKGGDWGRRHCVSSR